MKNMQDFYNQLNSGQKASSFFQRFLALTKFSKARLVATSQENEWYFWEAPQSVTAA